MYPIVFGVAVVCYTLLKAIVFRIQGSKVAAKDTEGLSGMSHEFARSLEAIFTVSSSVERRHLLETDAVKTLCRLYKVKLTDAAAVVEKLQKANRQENRALSARVHVAATIGAILYAYTVYLQKPHDEVIGHFISSIAGVTVALLIPYVGLRGDVVWFMKRDGRAQLVTQKDKKDNK
eukprot:m.33135 g.33135  ORF g.33135 m.33135 type:complete len:177 (+) comp9583_c0_seq1:149-679(+)